MFKQTFFITFIFFTTLAAAAQSGLVTTGGDIQGLNGSVSYTVGQVAVQSIEASAASLTEGVQQPYEIQTADQQTLKTFKVVKTR